MAHLQHLFMSGLRRVTPAIALTSVLFAYLAYGAIRARHRAHVFRRLNPEATIITLHLPFPLRLLLRRIVDPHPAAYVWHELGWLRSGFLPFASAFRKTVAVCSPESTDVIIADVDLIRQAAARPRDFDKRTDEATIFDVFGKSIVTVRGDVWRMHRCIAAPSFGERNNELVLDETLKALDKMFSSWDSTPDGVARVRDDMMQLALMIISGAAFGMKTEWVDSAANIRLTSQHKLSFQSALKMVNNSLIHVVLIPQLVLKNVPLFKNLNLALTELRHYLNEIIDGASDDGSEAAPASSQSNVLQLLTRAAAAAAASDGAEGDMDGATSATRFTRSDLLGNAFLFFFAGHETTANIISFSLAHLALDPALQDRVHDEARSVYGGGLPTYKQLSELHYATAVGNESLRMYPPVVVVPKKTDAVQQLGPFVIPANVNVGFNCPGVQNDPETWKDPESYDPWRFVVDGRCMTNPRGLIAFSEGGRACLGKRFAQIEIATIISVICSRYSIEPADGESASSLLESERYIALRPKGPVRLRFTRR